MFVFRPLCVFFGGGGLPRFCIVTFGARCVGLRQGEWVEGCEVQMESVLLFLPLDVEQRKKPQPTFRVSVKPWRHSYIHTYLGSFFLDPEDIKILKSGGHLELEQRNRSPLNWYQIMGHKGPVLRPKCFGTARARTQLLIEI